jgi:hypothetical protein
MAIETIPGALTVKETGERFFADVDWTKMIKPLLVVAGIVILYMKFGK